MGRQFRYMLLTLLLAASWSLSAAESNALQTDYFGNYRLGPDHVVGVNEFVTDGGERVALLADYSSGVVRRLFADADEKFVMGPGFNTAAPTELTVDFVKDSRGSITGLNYRPATGPQRFAERVPLQREDVSFRGAESLLAGTLITPRTKGLIRPSFCSMAPVR